MGTGQEDFNKGCQIFPHILAINVAKNKVLSFSSFSVMNAAAEHALEAKETTWVVLLHSPNHVYLFVASHAGQPPAILSAVVEMTQSRRDWHHHCRGLRLFFDFERVLLLSFSSANGLWWVEVTCKGTLCSVLWAIQNLIFLSPTVLLQSKTLVIL